MLGKPEGRRRRGRQRMRWLDCSSAQKKSSRTQICLVSTVSNRRSFLKVTEGLLHSQPPLLGFRQDEKVYSLSLFISLSFLPSFLLYHSCSFSLLPSHTPIFPFFSLLTLKKTVAFSETTPRISAYILLPRSLPQTSPRCKGV